jgi:hypothetical protein
MLLCLPCFPPNFLKFQMLVYHQSACHLYFLFKKLNMRNSKMVGAIIYMLIKIVAV